MNARLDVATELQALITPASGVTGAYGRREGIASVGFRLITVFSCLRGMIDTMGRVTGTADYTLAPGLTFNVSREKQYFYFLFIFLCLFRFPENWISVKELAVKAVSALVSPSKLK